MSLAVDLMCRDRLYTARWESKPGRAALGGRRAGDGAGQNQDGGKDNQELV